MNNCRGDLSDVLAETATPMQVAAGWLMQEHDSLVPEQIEFTCVSEAKPTPQQLEDLKFAWRCVKHVKSNAITVAKDNKLLGMGSGQPNRVKSVQIALEKVCSVVDCADLYGKPTHRPISHYRLAILSNICVSHHS